jgi:hypothetical protein
MAELFYIREGLMVKGNTSLTGSLTATAGITGSFTGSLTGTATTASYVLNAISASYAPQTAAFPYTGSAIITGSLNVTGSFNVSGSVRLNGNAGVTVIGNTTVTGSFKVSGSLDTNGKATIASPGFPLIVNSTNSNSFKITLQDNGVTRGYFGSGNGIPLQIGDSVGNPTHTFYGTGTISSLGGIYIGDASTTPSGRIHTKGTGATSATTNILVQNSSAANLFRITDDGRVTITGSLGINGGVTGSLLGTASYARQALSASWAPSAGGAAFPFTGSAQITGSLIISSSNITLLTLLGSGSTVPIFTVQGSQGELFSITDSLSGSLFSVNDVSGLPILEVFSDSTTFIGDYQAPALYTTKKITASSGVNLVYSLSTGSYDGVFMDYIIRSGSNSRAGTFTALWGSGGAVNYMDNSTTDFGSTSGFTFGASISGSNMIVTGSASTTGWTIKSIIRSI